ncbi:vomeronasal type-2 receptor 1-like [Ascaphus truei]|uniref:vomeronasal type-2 receptor 1-like n=1 Tax=Ascaphus truei TaxID=8439 RepID=UPI003F59CDC6
MAGDVAVATGESYVPPTGSWAITKADADCRLPSANLHVYEKEGDIIFGGLIPVHLRPGNIKITFTEKPTPVKCDKLYIQRYQEVLAMVYAINEINENPELLPNITLGFRIYDSCYKETQAIEGAMMILSEIQKAIPNYRCENISKLVGLIGDLQSSSSLAVARILGLYRFPQISYGSGFADLSDKIQFPSFLRTISNDKSQSWHFTNLMIHFGWTWVGILASDNDFGLYSSELMRKDIEAAGICVAFFMKISAQHSRDQTLSILQVIRKSTATVIVMYCSMPELIPFMQVATAEHFTGKIWFASGSWIASPIFSYKEFWGTLNGTIGITLLLPKIPGFRKLLYSIHPSSYPGDIFMKTFWEEGFGCLWPKEDHNQTAPEKLSQGSIPYCTGQENLHTLESLGYHEDKSRYAILMYNAVYAMAHGVNDMISCKSASSCFNISRLQPWKLAHHTPPPALPPDSPSLRHPGSHSLRHPVPGSSPSPSEPTHSSSRHFLCLLLLSVCLNLPPLPNLQPPEKPGQICATFSSNAQHQEASPNDALCTGPDLSDSFPGVLIRKESEAITLRQTPGDGVTDYHDLHIHKMMPSSTLEQHAVVVAFRSSHVGEWWSTGLAHLQSPQVQLCSFLGTIPAGFRRQDWQLTAICSSRADPSSIGYIGGAGPPLLHRWVHRNLLSAESLSPWSASGYPYNLWSTVHSHMPPGGSPTLQRVFMDRLPTSVCSEICPSGYRKAPQNGQPVCCFDCVLCSREEFSNETDSTSCMKCPDGMWPNERHDGCRLKSLEFLSYEDLLGGTLAALSIVGALLPLSILVIFLKNSETPIVKANNRGLSYLLLMALILCYLCSLLFIGHPLNITCILRQITFGVSFALCISCVLGKTIMVVIAFNSTQPKSNRPVWLNSRVPNTLVLVCTAIQVIICISWIAHSPPFQNNDRTAKLGTIIVECNEGALVAFWCMLGYMGLLATLSFVVAYLARKLPGSFNEAKLITFSMLIFGVVWVSFIPAYLSTRGKYMVAVEIFAILSSSSGLLVCLFIPKCYIIIMRPEMNNKEFLTGKRTAQKNKLKR